MLKELHITNIILIESSEIFFSGGLNVLTGESGSGKSAILNALHLIAGVRSDASLIRRGEAKGIVEARFDIDTLPLMTHLLEEAGIDHVPGEDLLIRREILATGKSRAFINNQIAQLSLLKLISEHLFEIVGQHANQKLFSIEYHRHLLDLYGSIKEDVAAFTKVWEEEIETRQLLEQMKNSQAQRLREIEVCHMEIEELENAALKECEEEDLFSEYTQLSNADELAIKVTEVLHVLTGEKLAVLAHLSRQKGTLEQLAALDLSLSDLHINYQNALLELQEIAYSLQSYESRIEHNPERIEFLNERLTLINRLKKKYGNSIKELHEYLAQTRQKLQNLESSDMQIEALEEKVVSLAKNCNELAKVLTEKRQQAALTFSAQITSHLMALNMPKVQFKIEIAPQKRNRTGDDRIEFFIAPNVGEHLVSVCECASGGELSRMSIAVQALLAGKEHIPTLIFDEIDANIGGETANIVGEKLSHISKNHQIICITHFPQVAKYADHHLNVYKIEVEGRTVTQVDHLNAMTKQKELERMRG